MGDEIATNIFMLGYAWQLGLVPLQRESIMRAIELNGVAIEANKKAFNFGRLAAHDMDTIENMMAEVRGDAKAEPVSATLEEMLEKRAAYLTAYQDEAYANRYRDTIAKVKAAELAAIGKDTQELPLTEATARYYHKVLAYKDEYEVARLYTDGDFMKDLKATFQGNYKLRLNLARRLWSKMTPPPAARKSANSGRGFCRYSACWPS